MELNTKPPTPMDISSLEAPSPGAMELVASPTPSCCGGAAGSPVQPDEDSSLGSPPIDDRSLHDSLTKNREKLKVKLLTRRPISQLVQQGIIPPLKASPQFLEQKQRLERAKMGDYLRNKMQQRPDRDTLIRAHILEDSKVDPSLQERQRRLKRARLKDDLNDRLAHRPGPLELIRGNILQADETFAQAIKEGTIPFKRTCEGNIVVRQEAISDSSDDSQNSAEAVSFDGAAPPAPTQVAPRTSSPGNRIETISLHNTIAATPTSSPQGTTLVLTTSDPRPLILCTPESFPVKASIPPPPPLPPTPVYFTLAQATTSVKPRCVSAATIIQSRKKTICQKPLPPPPQPQTQPVPPSITPVAPPASNKNRIIKFHEYKGPPSAAKNMEKDKKLESSYELLLQQQKLFLQWQLEQQSNQGQRQKMILPAPVNISNTTTISSDSYKLKCSKLEDMKVSDLKVELKKRSLPVSGSKNQLIERLKPFSDSIALASTSLSLATKQESVSLDQSHLTHSNSMPSIFELTPSGLLECQEGSQDNESVLAKMDILHKELLEKQRLHSLIQQNPQANVITLADGSNEQTLYKQLLSCQPNGVQIIHSSPHMVTLQVKAEPGQLLNTANISIVSPSSAVPSGQPVVQACQEIQAKSLQKQLLQQHLHHKLMLQKQQQANSGGSLEVSVQSTPPSPSPVKPSTVTMEKCPVIESPKQSHMRTYSLPADINKFIKKPPEYSEATKAVRKDSEVNLNDIFEIISKQEHAKFEVTRNPETGVVTLKEAADSPSAITTPFVTPLVPKSIVCTNNVIYNGTKRDDKHVPLSELTIAQHLLNQQMVLPSAVSNGGQANQTLAATLGISDVPMAVSNMVASGVVQGVQHSGANTSGQRMLGPVALESVAPNGTMTVPFVSKTIEVVPKAATMAVDNHHFAKDDLSVSVVHNGAEELGRDTTPPLSSTDSGLGKSQEDKIDFNVDLDDLESMEIHFDYIAPNSKQPFSRTSPMNSDQMSTSDFQEDFGDWWCSSNDIFQTKPPEPAHSGSLPTGSKAITLDTPTLETNPFGAGPGHGDPLLSITNSNSCGFSEQKFPSATNNNCSASISLYSEMQGLLCDDIIMSDWTSEACPPIGGGAPVNFDIHMQM